MDMKDAEDVTSSGQPENKPRKECVALIVAGYTLLPNYMAPYRQRYAKAKLSVFCLPDSLYDCICSLYIMILCWD
jgi:hypothetical protein